ncbi:MAG: ScyD/ScyE family protein, partial [Flavisolibacter sp.]|nr:ScyD/ScyE family protein [Flavisolibacter sp.]
MKHCISISPSIRVVTCLLRKTQALSILSFVFLFSSCLKDGDEPGPAKVSVLAKGFNNPRGLKFGPDGFLYVAEAGLGGTEQTSKVCPGPPLPGEHLLGSPTGGRISKVSSSGVRTTVTDKLPTAGGGFFILGVSDVAFYGNTLYALISGGGCSHGVPEVPNGIVKINSSESFTVVADLGGWQQTHPVAYPPEDFEPEGTWYSMVNVGNAFYALDPNHGELVKVT